jgi:hypothetical protein
VNLKNYILCFAGQNLVVRQRRMPVERFHVLQKLAGILCHRDLLKVQVKGLSK